MQQRRQHRGTDTGRHTQTQTQSSAHPFHQTYSPATAVALIESSGGNSNLSNRYRMIGWLSKGVNISTPDAPSGSGLHTPVTPDAPQVSMGVGEGQAEEGAASEVRWRRIERRRR